MSAFSLHTPGDCFAISAFGLNTRRILMCFLQAEFFSPSLCGGQFIGGIDAHQFAGIFGDDGLDGDIFAVCDFDDIGEIVFAGGIIIVDLRDCSFEECHGHTVDAGVDFANGDFFGCTIFKFDDACDGAVIISDDTSICGGFISDHGEAVDEFLRTFEHNFFEC